MYATGLLLIVVAIPSTIIMSFVFMSDRFFRLDGSEALFFGLGMITVEMLIASILLYFAKKITKHRDKASTKGQMNQNEDIAQ